MSCGFFLGCTWCHSHSFIWAVQLWPSCGTFLDWEMDPFAPHNYSLVHLSPVVRRVDSTIHWINNYPLNNSIGFTSVYPLGATRSKKNELLLCLTKIMSSIKSSQQIIWKLTTSLTEMTWPGRFKK